MSSHVPPSVPFHQKEDSHFVQLITNPDAFPSMSDVHHSQDQAFLRVRSYIHAVLAGDGERPYCPIVPFVEQQNGYHVRDYPMHPTLIDFPSVLEDMLQQFSLLSPRETFAAQPLDVTTVMAAFSHPEACRDVFCDALKDMHEKQRLSFIERGLMLAYMHPSHPLGSSSQKRKDPGDDPLYLSAIPLLVVRRMIPADDRFMRKPDEIAAYRQYFDA